MSETCCKCGRYVGFWNLDYSKEIVCTRCLLLGVKGIEPEAEAKALDPATVQAPTQRRRRRANSLPKDKPTLATA